MIGRIPVLDVQPRVDCGRRPVKAVPGETFPVTATVFREGPDAVGANVVLRDPGGRGGPWIPMRELQPGLDRWGAEITPDREGRWTFAVEAWGDPVTSWRQRAAIKVPAGVDIELTFLEGAELLRRAAVGVPKNDGREAVLRAADALEDPELPPATRLAVAQSAELVGVLTAHPLREQLSASRPLPLVVERERALFGSWYELFPRSEGARVRPHTPPVSGTLRTAAERLPAVAQMGFDVVYLPPIHPIGAAFRKGRGGALSARHDDVGSPWAIGSADGGHDAVHPDLGTLDDFDAFVARAGELGMEVALDFALQCSPDHPWVKSHPEWFTRRADGTIAFAENPPKKYQDIYPISFEQDFRGLVTETLRVLRFWMSHGVRIFRVDNPHTKPVVFWEKVIMEINRTDPDVLFLAEAFTRPAMMHTLAQIGFQQSYTYFTWRNTKDELTEYLTELSGPAASYMRPNFFVNTPDILHAYLQNGGRPAFQTRAVLAATLSPTWGMYAGYELCENTPAAPGSEEYADSEKYQLRPRDWAGAEASGESITGLVSLLNALRRRHPALRQLRNLHFHRTNNEHILAYSKRTRTPQADCVLIVVNLDPHHTHEATVSLDMEQLQGCGLTPAQEGGAEPFPVCDQLTGTTYYWGRDNYVRLEPGRADAYASSAHVLALRPSSQTGGSPNDERQ
ncbi:alpha-1,4-glucan:maltose-1-phosphate maltosyltransferase [Streptomyces zhaozhouensis]|uniref:Alpha-1,4-glucan:maltose-1-phosphate maltosyltransferase n=1 Tax=Streptomyces zhaozhouensis TaxID=1300267 RepID=A0A286DKG6_9ACTN|nr:alpha-1,4-glucan--maltose-1-phosphate maltosyltransferase [Streptomyces zhaozhouensis]SOD59237.1 alpha-1,4-glucan:maltose-1-phosphate maltosyltransferase [Streptomyces zhaozhouensis]